MSALTPEAKYKKLRRAGAVVPPELIKERNGILARRKKEINAGAKKNPPGSKREYDDRAHRLGVLRTQRHRARKKAEKAAEKAKREASASPQAGLAGLIGAWEDDGEFEQVVQGVIDAHKTATRAKKKAEKAAEKNTIDTASTAVKLRATKTKIPKGQTREQ